MSSTRLPGKVLADVQGEPMLALQLRRLEHSALVERTIVATSDGPDDDPIEALARELGVRAYRGPRDDVLSRLAGAAADHDGEIVRLTADCPLIDPDVVDGAIALYRTTPGCDYVQNVEPRTYPDGLDVEVLGARLLRDLDSEVRDPSEREHVTVALRARRRGETQMQTLPGDPELAELRWTVDTADDLAFVQAVVARLGERRHDARLEEILAAVRADPSLAEHGGWRRG
jgi:spore coat polysaccharide biosynthesis protein SpsF (cytidylyltransferase family)